MAVLSSLAGEPPAGFPGYRVSEDESEIRIDTPQLEAAIRKQGYVSGVSRQSFLDKKTGFREAVDRQWQQFAGKGNE